MVAVAQLVESRIVIPVVVGSSPISHPIISFQKTSNLSYFNPVEITLYSCVLMVACKMSVMGLKGGISAGTGGVCGVMATSQPALQIRRLLRLEKNHQEQTIVLNDEQSRLLDQHYPDEPVEQTQTGLDNYLKHYNKQWSCQGLMMEGQAPLLHAQEGSEIGAEEGVLLEWCKQDTGLRPVSYGNYICACYYQLIHCQQYSLTCS